MKKIMQTMKITFLLLLMLMSFAYGMSGCSPIDSTIHDSATTFDQLKDDEYDSNLKMLSDFTKVAENEQLELSINPMTAEFAVKQMDSGEIWYSNPQDRQSDQLASGHTQSLLSSQIIVEYIDKANKKYAFNSYDNSVASGNFSFAKPKTGEGIIILYEFSETEKRYIVPSLIEKTRFENILEALPEEDRLYLQSRYNYTSLKDASDELKELLTTNYPSVKDHDLYVLAGNMPDFVMEKIEERFARSGYSADDLAIDNEMNYIQPPVEPAKIRIPLELSLDNNSVTARIGHERIECSGNVRFTKIEFLPYFGAGGVADEGYMVIPDGSGAIIDFNNGKLQYQPVSIPIYGADMAIEKKSQILLQRQAYLPVFGVHRNDGGCIAIIESSDAAAVIHADISGRTNSYNYIYPAFNLISYSAAALPYGKYDPVEIFSEEFLPADISVRYCFMKKGKTQYQDMAFYLKDRLLSTGLITADPSPDMDTLLELIGAVDYNNSVAGIPIRSYKALTSYENVSEIVHLLSENDVDEIAIQYTGWHGGGLRNSLNDRVRLMDVLGTKSDFSKMLADISTSAIDMYLDADILSLEKNGVFDKFVEKRDTARTLTNDLAYLYEYDLATRERTTITRRYLVKPVRLKGIIPGLLASYSDYEAGAISLGKAGSMLYSDFYLRNNTTRTATKDIITDIFETTAENGFKILADGGNLYTLQHLDRLTECSLGSSGFYLTDYDVPFFQLATSGCFEYYGQPLNLSSDTSIEFMKALEYGSLISFQWTYSPNYELKDTDYNFYSTNYENWMDLASETNNKMKEIFGSSDKHVLTGHQKIDDKVYSSQYGDSLTIITNYSNLPVDIRGFHIPGYSYQVIREEGKQ
ncbi:MAG: DUF5696 domain-containing protein [Saccharofermentanales bacterium]